MNDEAARIMHFLLNVKNPDRERKYDEKAESALRELDPKHVHE
jgi:hypothetical protein